MPKPTTKSPARHEMVMDKLMQAAERLFAQQGVAGTSLQELADAVGLTRTGIYHYVKNKDEMLEALVKGFTLETAEELQRLAEDSTAPALERLREGVTAMAAKVAEHPQRFRLLLTSEEAFPEPIASQHRAARRDTLQALTDMVAQAITEDSCRPVDPELAAFSLAGVANWVAFWYPRKEGAASGAPRDIAAALTDIALGGLLSTRETDGGKGVPAALALLKEDVDRLTHLLSETSTS
ncbi:TetR/AcrR family transcriptional regulator [Rhodococcus opacus]|uniref:TetR/AcrR family transcriptional regulator n=1 Tax=Rhodococcus opacus TaxID=37919 RepID=UPI0024733688|nr:TetR/AcrR family transcriptional regulator [Rhodococcus opacus]